MIGHSLGRMETCFGWDPRHPRCWDPIAKHISNPDFLATSHFDKTKRSNIQLKLLKNLDFRVTSLVGVAEDAVEGAGVVGVEGPHHAVRCDAGGPCAVEDVAGSHGPARHTCLDQLVGSDGPLLLCTTPTSGDARKLRQYLQLVWHTNARPKGITSIFSTHVAHPTQVQRGN